MKWTLFFAAAFLFFPAFTSASSEQIGSLRPGSESEKPLILPFESSVPISDSMLFTRDGADIVRVSGTNADSAPIVTIQRDTEAPTQFEAYPEGYRGGVTVAACDLTGDGRPEIITGTRAGGGPHVRIFTLDGDVLFGGGFFAYADQFRGGVNVACGDLDGDGSQELITAPGIGGSAHIRRFTAQGKLLSELIVGSALESAGAQLIAGNLDTDTADELVVSKLTPGSSDVFTLDLIESYWIISDSYTINTPNSNLALSLYDANGDGIHGILSLPKRLPLTRLDFHSPNGEIVESIDLPKELEGSVRLLAHPNNEVALVHNPDDRGEISQRIVVDISEQRLRAYENGVEVRSFLISSGTYQFPTPLGTTEVTAKLPVHRYRWSYGPNNPNNYDIPGVKWNLRFRQNYYIHSATWHNNFGRRMSHGCINVDTTNAEWIYNWAEVGATVEIVP